MLSRTHFYSSVAALALIASPLSAQRIVDGPMGPPPRGDFASFLLAHVVDLKLTDAQVTRLAGIARKSDEQRRPLIARADSLRRIGPRDRADSVNRATLLQRRETAQAAFEAMQEQERVARRDAIALLTPDQQARLYELRDQRGNMGAGRMTAMRRGFGAMRGGPGAPPEGPRARVRRGPDGPPEGGRIDGPRQGDEPRLRRPRPPQA